MIRKFLFAVALAPAMVAAQSVAVAPPTKVVTLTSTVDTVSVGDTLRDVTAIVRSATGSSSPTSKVKWSTVPVGVVRVVDTTGNNGQRVGLVGLAPGAVQVVATWTRTTDKQQFTGTYGFRVSAPTAPPPVTPSVLPPAPPPLIDFSSGAHYYDDFSSYTNTAELLSKFWVGRPNHDNGGVTGRGQPISYDTLERAMRYDWPSRSNSMCSSTQTPGPGQIPAEVTTALMPRWYALPTNTGEIWVRFTTKESPNFEHGRSGCGGRSYKYFLLVAERQGLLGRAGLYLGNGRDTLLSTRAYLDFNTIGSAASYASGVRGGFDIGGDAAWGGIYHTWVIGLERLGTPTSTFSVYLDGKLLSSIDAPFLGGQSIAGLVLTFEMGANINNGPDHAQSRWWREFGVYTSRPSIAPLFPR